MLWFRLLSINISEWLTQSKDQNQNLEELELMGNQLLEKEVRRWSP